MAKKIQNLNTSLKRRNRPGDPMAAYDKLPLELRKWLAQAALPWSARSALRLWHKAMHACDGDTCEACGRLSRAEQAMLRKDARSIWGESYPAA
jgi:hypothetical protein